MNKPAPTDVPILPLLTTRYSTLSFDPAKPVTAAELTTLFEAARWAPSCYNEQPWGYVAAHREDSANFQRIFSCLVPGNQTWTKDAGVLAIGCAKQNFAHDGKPNRHAWHDLGQATMSLTVQAESMGLRVHQMGGIDFAACTRELKIPAGWEPAVGIAIGRPAGPEHLAEALRARETAARSRKPRSAFVFTGTWGQA